MSKETVPRPAESDLEENDSKPEINGGLEAWLTVLALFCVFVNSW